MGCPVEVAPSIGRPISRTVSISSGAIGFMTASGPMQTYRNLICFSPQMPPACSAKYFLFEVFAAESFTENETGLANNQVEQIQFFLQNLEQVRLWRAGL